MWGGSVSEFEGLIRFLCGQSAGRQQQKIVIPVEFKEKIKLGE